MSTDVATLSVPAREAITRLLEDPIFEVIPLPNALDQARYLPSGARVSLTASPTRSLDGSLDLAGELIEAGFRVTPHLSARMTHDREHLRRLLARMDDLGVRSAFVVGGDGGWSGYLADGLALLEEMESIGHSLQLGVPCYPEGHPSVSDGVLTGALAAKQPYVSWMTSQMCFDPDALENWAAMVRRSGIDLPLVLGLPGVADRLKLARIASRIGVGSSLAFLRKNAGLVTAFVKPGGYDPGELLLGLGERLEDPELGIVGCHIYTFNQCDATEDWRRSLHDALAGFRA